MSLVLDEHRRYLTDRHRVERYAAALRALVQPGMTVADVASGTGILGLLACRAGASRVYAIEHGAIASLARTIARANGSADRIAIVRGHSAHVDLPERVDLVVSDQLGRFGFEAGLLRISADARGRFLKPGGTLIPSVLDLIVAPVEHRPQARRVAFWSRRPWQFDFSAAQAIGSNTGYPVRLRPEHIIATPAAALRIPLASDISMPLRVEATFTIERDATLDGVAGWFSAQLSPGISMTNSPLDSGRIARRQAFFPIATPTAVATGDCVAVRMQILPDDLMVAWEVAVRATGRDEVRFRHSTLHGMLVDGETLAMTDPDYRPVLTPRGSARLSVLELCDGIRPLREIEAEVFARHRHLFDSPEAAAVFVGEVIQRYTSQRH